MDFPIVLLPGLDGTGELLHDLEVALVDLGCRVQIMSYPADEPLGYSGLVDWVVERLPRERCILIGESFSGPIAIEIAVRQPGRVAGLVLAATFARCPLPTFISSMASILDPMRAPRFLRRLMLLGDFADTRLATKLDDVLSTVSSTVVRARVREILRVDKRDLLRSIKVPCLYLSGRRDKLVRARVGREIATLVPRCRVLSLDAPHMLLATHALEVAIAISEFGSKDVEGADERARS